LNKTMVRRAKPSQVPTYYIGPMLVKHEIKIGEYWVPISTTEAILPYSIRRGIRIINKAGGCNVHILREGMTRCPIFETSSAKDAIRVREFIDANREKLNEITEISSAHLELLSNESWIIGKYIFVRFGYLTDDAMGMNMVTNATDNISRWITDATGCRIISLSSNLCTDKKPSGINFLLGRGKSVVAECNISSKLIKDELHTTVQKIVEVTELKNILGSAIAFTPTHLNAQVANFLAGIFIATGQDVAQIVESSMGVFLSKINADGSLYISLTLPSLEVGTVGGGTSQFYAQRALSKMRFMDLKEANGTNARRFAEIITAACLAGELSLIGCLAEGSLAKVQNKYGKTANMKVNKGSTDG
jgi:hydroxymethylglutaryl-CoA reductase (NADPH)